MKKLIAIFITICLILSFYISYKQFDQNEKMRIYSLGQNIGYKFFIPNNKLLANPNEIYPILEKTSSELKLNILRSSINNKPNNKVEFVKYILLNNKTDIFDSIALENGKPLSYLDTHQNYKYISSLSSEDPNQIGTVKDFGKNDIITFKSLKSSFNYIPVSGYYFVESSNILFEKFLKEFTMNLNNYFKTKGESVHFSVEEFKSNERPDDLYQPASITNISYLLYVFLILISFLILYYMFNETKRIGIYKLHGYSNFIIWKILVGKLIFNFIILSAIITQIYAFNIPNFKGSFFYFLFLNQLKIFLILIITTFPSYIYICRININNAIKNKKNTNIIFLFNTFFKIASAILLIMTIVSSFNDYKNIKVEENYIKDWKKSDKYGVFYPVNSGYDSSDFQNGAPNFVSVTGNALYPVLNKMGSLFINARQYEDTALLLDKDYKGFRSIKVNNNYLSEFPIYDEYNKKIKISENDTNWIVLVPKNLKYRQKEIKSFFKDNIKERINFEEKSLELKVPTKIKNQKIRIIWTKDNQEVFSFNPDVYPRNHNNIIDPIVEIITEKNSLNGDRDSILGGGGVDPMKIKLIDKDTAKTYLYLKPTLEKLKIDDNINFLITIDQYIGQKIYFLKQKLYMSVLTIITTLIIFLFVVIQNIFILFNKFQSKFVIRGLFGFSLYRKYKEAFLILSMLWILVITISIWFVNNQILFVLILSTILIVFELFVSIYLLLKIENRDKIKILKGGE